MSKTLREALEEAFSHPSVIEGLTQVRATDIALKAISEWEVTDEALLAFDVAYDDLGNNEKDAIKAALQAACAEKSHEENT